MRLAPQEPRRAVAASRVLVSALLAVFGLGVAWLACLGRTITPVNQPPPVGSCAMTVAVRRPYLVTARIDAALPPAPAAPAPGCACAGAGPARPGPRSDHCRRHERGLHRVR